MVAATSGEGVGTSVGVRELKNQLSRYLDQVKAGAEVTVTQHGRPIARLSPVGGEVDRRQCLIDDGVIVPAKRPRKLPGKQIAMAPGPSITELLEHERR